MCFPVGFATEVAGHHKEQHSASDIAREEPRGACRDEPERDTVSCRTCQREEVVPLLAFTELVSRRDKIAIFETIFR